MEWLCNHFLAESEGLGQVIDMVEETAERIKSKYELAINEQSEINKIARFILKNEIDNKKKKQLVLEAEFDFLKETGDFFYEKYDHE